NGLSQLRSAKNPNLPRPTHPVLSTPWLAALEKRMKYSFPDDSPTNFLAPTQNNAKPCRHHRNKTQLKSLSAHRDRRLCPSEDLFSLNR
ncbi:hypothetical protein K661_02495, partial [Piscirickettsia salmonis LF-89 = ATCC VR-1361]